MDRNVDVEPDLRDVSLALSQPSRCAILQALMGGIALPASELAYRAGISNATASAHLKQLTNAGLIRPIQTGRHRYYELTNHVVAGIVEALSVLAPKRPRDLRKSGPTHLHKARLCYDHLAGELGVAVTNALMDRAHIKRRGDLIDLLPKGAVFLESIGVDIHSAMEARRCFARVCIDWSERQPHLAGALGAALTRYFIAEGWIVRNPDDRSVETTPRGAAELSRLFGVGVTS